MTDKNQTIMPLILLLLPNENHPFVLRTKVLAPKVLSEYTYNSELVHH